MTQQETISAMNTITITQKLKKDERYVVVEKYIGRQSVLLQKINDDQHFKSPQVRYEHDFEIDAGDELVILSDSSEIKNETARIVENSKDQYIVGSGLLIKRRGKFFFMENKASVGKIVFVFSIVEYKGELNDEMRNVLQSCVKQFSIEELEDLENALNGNEESIKKFTCMGCSHEYAENFFEKYRNDLLHLDRSRSIDSQLCDFNNLSPPKGKTDSRACLRAKSKKYATFNGIRFKLFKHFPERMDTMTHLLWNAITECVEETNSLPECFIGKTNVEAHKFETIQIPLVSLDFRNETNPVLKRKAERMVMIYFIINEECDSKFRLNTDFKEGHKKEKHEYKTKEYWVSSRDEHNLIPKCFRDELKNYYERISNVNKVCKSPKLNNKANIQKERVRNAFSLLESEN